jgi:hypothetical protein
LYVILAWEHLTGTNEQVVAGNEAFLAVVKERSWVHPLQNVNLYVIRVNDATDQASIHNQCIGVTKTFPSMRFLITPVLPPGSFSGWLEAEMWPKLNERTAQ